MLNEYFRILAGVRTNGRISRQPMAPSSPTSNRFGQFARRARERLVGRLINGVKAKINGRVADDKLRFVHLTWSGRMIPEFAPWVCPTHREHSAHPIPEGFENSSLGPEGAARHGDDCAEHVQRPARGESLPGPMPRR